MKRIGLFGILAVAFTAALLAAGCGGGGEEAAPPAEPPAEPAPPSEEPAATGEEPAPPAEEPAGGAPKGGTYRVDVESAFDFTAAFDPTAEYTAVGQSFYTLMLRPLMTYRHTAGAAGNEAIPDLAADLPEISSDGMTYTFTLRDGVMFAPPVSREVTSQDVKYAFTRLANPEINVGGYSGYYTDIVGFEEFGAGEADDIAGIETPDDKTVVFTLEKPLGDFLYRLAMAATAPIPEEVAQCFTEVGGYARFIIASGAYMMEGTDALDITSCDTMEPISGYDPEAHLIFVRNPNYDPATENPDARENNPDRFEFRINSNADDCFNRVREAIIDDTLCGETPKEIREYTQDEELQDNLKLNPDDSVFYLSMRLTEPPFDDVHVRRAVNYVMDRDGLRLAWGGPSIGELARHVAPPSLAPPELADYDPYNVVATEGLGDVEAAMEEMRQSKYDTDQDGLCDAPECKEVLTFMGTLARDDGMIPVMQESLAKIGIELAVAPERRRLQRVARRDEARRLQRHGRLGQGLSRRLHDLLLSLRRPDDPADLDQRRPRRLDGGASGGVRDPLPGRARAERGRGHRQLHRDRRCGRAPDLLGGARQEADGGGRPLRPLDLAKQQHDHRRLGGAVGLRPVEREPGVDARRGRPVVAEQLETPTAPGAGRPAPGARDRGVSERGN